MTAPGVAPGLLFSRGMPRATAFLAGVAAVLLIGPPVAHAGDTSELATAKQAAPLDNNELFPDAPGHHALAFNLGLGSAVGLAGVTYSLGFGAAELEIGLGFGVTAWQTSGMLKVALYGTPTFRLVTGAGLAFTSGAPFSAQPIGNRGFGEGTGNPIWLNLDIVGVEYRSPSHFYAAGSFGLTRGLGNGTDLVKVANNCGSDECYDNVVSAGWFPQVRGAIGAWF
jgi:hypothetical protein